MGKLSKQDLLDAFRMPREEFDRIYTAQAARLLREHKKGVALTAMLGYSNICKNHCLYCGMRAPNTALPRYRMSVEDMVETIRGAYDAGLRRLFLIAGDDPKYTQEDLRHVVRAAREMGFSRISMAAGEFGREDYAALQAAGLTEYVLKFEMSHRDTFERLNPSSDFDRRRQAMGWIREAGLELGSGNIVDYPGQTLDELADDILLMEELKISWAPNIPYMPAQGTPLAAEGGPGRVDWMQREIALVRVLLPDADITAQQPGADPRKGMSDPEGNLAAIAAGANVLFVDLLPPGLRENFRVVDGRIIQSLEEAKERAAQAGLPWLTE